MKVQILKENNLSCIDFINCLIAMGYKTVAEAMESEKNAE